MTIPPTPQNKISETEVTDPVEVMLQKTGCIELHYKVQECIATTKDWRLCQTEVQEFRACMTKFTKSKQEAR